MRPDDLDWQRLEHARGPAHDLPARIEALSGPDAGPALVELFELLYDHGVVYSATAAAIPLLTDKVLDADTPHRRGLLELMRRCALGRSPARRQGPLDELDPAVVAEGERVVRRVQTEVLRACDRLQPLVHDPDLDLATATAWMLSVGDRALPDQPDAPELLRATLLVSATTVDPLGERRRALSALAGPRGLLQLAGALATAWSQPPPHPPNLIPVLVSWLEEDPAEVLPFVGDLRIELAHAIRTCGDASTIPLLLGGLEGHRTTLSVVAEPLLALAFPSGRPARLSGMQREVLALVARKTWTRRRGEERVNHKLVVWLTELGLLEEARGLRQSASQT